MSFYFLIPILLTCWTSIAFYKRALRRDRWAFTNAFLCVLSAALTVSFLMLSFMVKHGPLL